MRCLDGQAKGQTQVRGVVDAHGLPWANSHHIAGDLHEGVRELKDATPAGVLLGSGKLATPLDRLDLIDEYRLFVQPSIAGHGPTLYQDRLPGGRCRLG
ncbi:hypothetical protein D2L64_22565 [Micromonospora radicis]|uniref:Bacterial bifunctional deaminase-reductase C-terminal domain-containing protein n=2 Tax=Micromonospora radicis TaxID=1894971 RepID=A0A418MPW1_9ACTN|nr:hypothetical protein D2L64_22565 [Micromonospora radicis]